MPSVDVIALNPNRKQLISGSSDGTVRIWNIKTGKEISTVVIHKESINSVKFFPCGNLAISVADDNTLRVWNINNGDIVSSFSGESKFTCFTMSPERQTIVVGENSGRIHFLSLNGFDLMTK